MIDYIAVGNDEGFRAYELAVGELQLVSLADMEPAMRKAFVINLYNTIIPHAFAKVGIAGNDLARVAFYDIVSYVVGGAEPMALTLNDLENGILRENRAPPFHLGAPFKVGSPQMAAVLPIDHRIHFALNCGAKSCPPVKWFTKEAIEDELRVVAMAWVEEDENVKVDLS